MLGFGLRGEIEVAAAARVTAAFTPLLASLYIKYIYISYV
jgi:hypothetical protein